MTHISTDIFYKVGSKNETMGKSGIAHMLEHMNFKSTKHLQAGDFDKEVKGYGGIDNASTGFDYTHYYIKSSTKHLRENAYIYHPYHWTPIGFINDIKTWTLKDIKDFHKTYYQPQNAILVVSGDVDAKDVFKDAKKAFGKIRNHKKIPKFKFIEPPQDGPKHLTVYKDTQVQMIAIAFHIPNFKHKDQVALSAISELLSSGRSSRLYADLVDKKHLVNQIYAYNMQNTDPGLFIFMAVCNPGIDAKKVERELHHQIDLLKKTKVSHDELEKVKMNTKADFIYSLESSTSVANLFGGYLARGDIKPLAKYEKNINALTANKIEKVAKKYFNFDHSTTIILKSKSQGEQ